jgi:glycosyltransferase involved in cell wall biosynthesis
MPFASNMLLWSTIKNNQVSYAKFSPLSVVVAVYNGEAFLDQFFTCLVNQRIDSMEVIIVNDGLLTARWRSSNWREKLPQLQVIEQQNQGVSIARNTGLAVATVNISFPDIDDVSTRHVPAPAGYGRHAGSDVATCNGTTSGRITRNPRPIFPEDKLASTGVWLALLVKKALDSRKFLHVTWLNIYRHDFIRKHTISSPACAIRIFRGPPKCCWRQSACSTPVNVLRYYIHSASVSHKPDNDDTLMRSRATT